VAIASFLSAALLLAALIYSSSQLSQQADDIVDRLFIVDDNKGQVFLVTVLQALSTALLAAPLWFLYQATRFRRREIPAIAKWLALIAPIASALLSIVRQIQVADIADRVHRELATNPLRPNDAIDFAERQLDDGAVQLVGGLALAAGLGLAFAFIVISLNAMRAGLMSRFMGILGIIVGVLFIIPLLGSIPFVEIFWVAALGMLFLGKWPQGGRGPAWETGEAIPWPTAVQRQEELAAARAGGDDDEDEELDEGEATPPRQAVTAGRRPAPDPEPDADEHHDGAARQHPRSKKRKRKRR